MSEKVPYTPKDGDKVRLTGPLELMEVSHLTRNDSHIYPTPRVGATGIVEINLLEQYFSPRGDMCRINFDDGHKLRVSSDDIGPGKKYEPIESDE